MEAKNQISGPAIPIVVWKANMLACPQCGFKIVKIKDQRPIATCIDPDFAERLERIKKNRAKEEIMYVSQ